MPCCAGAPSAQHKQLNASRKEIPVSTTAVDATEVPDIQRTRWRIDPKRSSVEFHVRNLWGLQTVKGRFERYDGILDLTAQPSIELTIEAESLNASQVKRDEHLRSADFFDAANHPQVRFVSQRATLDGDRLDLQGELHAAGRSVPIELDGVIRPVGDELDVDVETFADHRLLGMTWNRLGMLRAPSKLVVRGRLVRDEKELLA
jgi:polyisoprenoid-binding protein YceI